MAFTAMTLPKQMKFKPPRGGDWFAEYNWIAFPEENMPPRNEAAMNTDLNQVAGAAAATKENRQLAANKPKSNLKGQRGQSASKSVKFDPNAVPTAVPEEERKQGAAVAGIKKRPLSAVKGKSGKLLPKAPAKPMGKKRAQESGSEEQKTRKTKVVQEVEEEEVKLTPEELYEIELKETQERQ